MARDKDRQNIDTGREGTMGGREGETRRPGETMPGETMPGGTTPGGTPGGTTGGRQGETDRGTTGGERR